MTEERGFGLVRTVWSTSSGHDVFPHEPLVFISFLDATGWATVCAGLVRTTESTIYPIAINVLSDPLNHPLALVLGILDHGIAHIRRVRYRQ